MLQPSEFLMNAVAYTVGQISKPLQRNERGLPGGAAGGGGFDQEDEGKEEEGVYLRKQSTGGECVEDYRGGGWGVTLEAWNISLPGQVCVVQLNKPRQYRAAMNETIPPVSDSHPSCAIQIPPLWSREVGVDQAEGAVVKVQRGGVAIAGHKGNAKVDTHGVAVSGVGGYSGAPSHFHGVIAVSDSCGFAEAGDGGVAFTGSRGKASCNNRSYAFALQEGWASAAKYSVASTEGGFAQANTLGIALAFGVEKKWSRASVAKGGVAIGTPGNYVRAGCNGVLIALPPETSCALPPNVVQVGKGDIKPNQWYRIENDLSFLEVSPELGPDLDDKWKPLRENARLESSCAD